MKNVLGGMIGEVLEQGGSVVKQTAKQVANTLTDLTKVAVGQVGVVAPTGTNESASGNAQAQQNTQSDAAPSEKTAEETKEFVKKMYAPSDNADKKKAEGAEKMQKLATDNPDKTPEELQKIEQLLQSLHQQTYYDPTFNRPQQEEERPAEKVEREKMEDLQKEQQDLAKKPDDTAIKQAQTRVETAKGVSG